MKLFTYLIVIILLILGIFYSARAHADNHLFDLQFLINEGDSDYVNPKWPVEKKCMMHGMHMRENYTKAEKITWYLPEYEDREKGKLCFATAVSLAVPPNNIPKIITIAIGLLTKYGLDCIDSFAEVNHYLHRANYHAEMYKFYLELLPDD